MYMSGLRRSSVRRAPMPLTRTARLPVMAHITSTSAEQREH